MFPTPHLRTILWTVFKSQQRSILILKVRLKIVTKQWNTYVDSHAVIWFGLFWLPLQWQYLSRFQFFPYGTVCQKPFKCKILRKPLSTLSSSLTTCSFMLVLACVLCLLPMKTEQLSTRLVKADCVAHLPMSPPLPWTGSNWPNQRQTLSLLWRKLTMGSRASGSQRWAFLALSLKKRWNFWKIGSYLPNDVVFLPLF